MKKSTAPLLVLALTALVFMIYPWDGHRAFTQDKEPVKGGNRQKANRAQPQGEDGTRKGPPPEGEAAKRGKAPDPASPAGKKKRPPKPKSNLKFQSVVKIGPALFSNCTARCHVNFPFSATGKFRHSYHAPEDGFDCTLCHSMDPVNVKTHGRLVLPRTGCVDCHHDPERFPACETCHLPVKKNFFYKRTRFEHEKHAFLPDSPACITCHGELDKRAWQRTPIECLTCHHVDAHPLDCLECHKKSAKPRMSARFKGFDHDRHRTSEYLQSGCATCHEAVTAVIIPDEMDCNACHHPEDPALYPSCAVCHDETRLPLSRSFPDFAHASHIQAELDCLQCHDRDPLRTAVAGRDCIRCHHEDREGCRKCHKEKIYFITQCEISPFSDKVPFLHAAHERDDNCIQCHATGKYIRRGVQAMNCADCHHHAGSTPSCTTCHSEIERLRSGSLPSGREGEPDAMFRIVSCNECHHFDPAAHKGITDGTAACIECHPEQYGNLLKDMRMALERALDLHGREEDRIRTRKKIRLGLHNFRLVLEDIRASHVPPEHD